MLGLVVALMLIAAVTWQSVVLLVVTMIGVLLTTHLVRTRLFGDKGRQQQKQTGRTWSSVKRDAVASATRRRQPAGGRKKAKKK